MRVVEKQSPGSRETRFDLNDLKPHGVAATLEQAPHGGPSMKGQAHPTLVIRRCGSRCHHHPRANLLHHGLEAAKSGR